MIRQPNIVRSGFGPLTGMDSSVPPDLIEPTRCALMVNADVRESYFGTRPAFKLWQFKFPFSDDLTWCTIRPFQGAGAYRVAGSWEALAMTIAGRTFLWQPATQQVTEITPTKTVASTADWISPPVDAQVTVQVSDSGPFYPGLPVTVGSGRYLAIATSGAQVILQNRTDTPGELRATGTPLTVPDVGWMQATQAWHCQVGRYLIVQDGQTAPLIFDGSSSRRADMSRNEVPVGGPMAYHAPIGRLAVAIGNDIALSDYAGAESDVLRFTEERELAIGGRFRIPDDYGPVRALVPLPTLDTTTGHGALLVGATGGIFSLNLPPDRTAWKTTARLVTLIAPGPGPEHSDLCCVNGDVFYRAADGVRSISAARSVFGRWSAVPVSGEASRLFKGDTDWLLSYCSMATADNRLFCTVRPQPESAHGVMHGGLAVLDFAPVSRLGSSSAPAWAGLWTGASILRLVAVERKLFAVCIASDQSLCPIQLLSEEPDDPGPTRIRSVLETAVLPRQSLPGLYRLLGAEAWLDQVSGECEMTLYYRPDQYPCWIEWDKQKFCALKEMCQRDDVCQAQVTYEPGYRTRVTWRRPPGGSDPLDDKPLDVAYGFQFRIELVGRARLLRLIGKFEPVVEEVIRTDG